MTKVMYVPIPLFVHIVYIYINKYIDISVEMGGGRNITTVRCYPSIRLKSHTLIEFQPRWLSGMRCSLVHSLMIARHCVLRNWDRISVRAVKGLISWAGIVSICP